ncbi:MAG TPA: metallophosphoesterase family protein [Candidatus Polarisedimenticolia bacterium]|jgi:hypothetical protein
MGRPLLTSPILCAFLLAAPAPALAAETVLVESGTTMRYLSNLSDPGIGLSWTAQGFNASAWPSGVYGVGYELATGAQNLIRTTVPGGSSSVYTRATFTIANPAAVTNLYLGADYDDGYAAWINGVPVHLSPQMPSGNPAWNSRPASHESTNGQVPGYEPLVDISSAGIPALRAGENVLAIGVWNQTATSSDLVLVPRLSINRPVAIKRGPYLQSGAPDSVVIRWRTDRPADSRVMFGPEPGLLTSVVEDASLTTDHVVKLAGLSPDTRYYYAVGTTSDLLAGADADHYFATSPAPGASRPTRVWVIGDSGTADAGARSVRDAYEAFAAGGPRANLWLMLGDNAYQDGTDAEFQAAVFDMYPGLLQNTVLWPTLGNHDGHTADSSTQSGPYYDIFTLPTAGEAGGLASGTEAYYSFDYGDIHFICLESYETDRSSGGAMLTWLREDLVSTNRKWIIAFWHHPPYSRGSHDSDFDIELIQMRENALPILEQGGVDLVLAGHSHSYERSFLLDRHYGYSNTLTSGMVKDSGDGRDEGTGAYRKPPAAASPHEGAVYVVAGSSGSIGGGRLNHPAMYLSLNSLGSLVLDIDGRRLDALFLDGRSRVLDHFTILKKTAHPPRAVAAVAPRVECVSPSGAMVTLDGSASTDEDSAPGAATDIVEYRWMEDFGQPAERLLGTGERLDVTLPLGSHAITLEVIDSGGDADTDQVDTSVVDTTPPEMALTVRPETLWPPNGRMVRVSASVAAQDLCGDVEVVLESIASSDASESPVPQGRRGGPDIRGAGIGSFDLDFELRAERAGPETSRVYTITYTAADRSGNQAATSALVTVPHDRHRNSPSPSSP